MYSVCLIINFCSYIYPVIRSKLIIKVNIMIWQKCLQFFEDFSLVFFRVYHFFSSYQIQIAEIDFKAKAIYINSSLWLA